MEKICAKIVELLEKGRPSVLATIIRLVGSGPRGAGTRFLVMEDGSFVGTIGGGLLEARVLEGARRVLESGKALRIRMFLTGTDVSRTDMICGGDVEVFLEPLLPGNPQALRLFTRLRELGSGAGSGLLVTLVDEDRQQQGQLCTMLLEKGGETIGSTLLGKEIEAALRQEMEGLLKRRQPGLLGFSAGQGSPMELFVDTVTSRPVLYLFGGGHVSLQIVPLASRVGFKVAVVDDRPEYADPMRFPEAEQVLQMPFEGVLERLAVDGASYLVIVTRGHTHDKLVLEQCLRTGAKYVGMIGSRRKKAMIFESLLQEGFAQADLDRVHAPIGLDIGAETPEEIAVSIVAELIQVRAGGGKRLKAQG